MPNLTGIRTSFSLASAALSNQGDKTYFDLSEQEDYHNWSSS